MTAYSSLNKFGSLSITLILNMLPSITFKFAFYTMSIYFLNMLPSITFEFAFYSMSIYFSASTHYSHNDNVQMSTILEIDSYYIPHVLRKNIYHFWSLSPPPISKDDKISLNVVATRSTQHKNSQRHNIRASLSSSSLISL